MISFPIYVTIDSNIFDENKYDFSSDSTLSLLINYVESGEIKIVLSNIVINEVKTHIIEGSQRLATEYNKMRKEIRKLYSDDFIIASKMDFLLTEKANKDDITNGTLAQFNDFLQKIQIEVLNSSGIDADEIFTDYFNYNPPFENKEKKRNEFPDAFITAQIQNRFTNEDYIAIVSKDKGFKSACGNHTNYHFFESLSQLYDTITKEKNTYSEALLLINQICPQFNNKITNAISSDNITVNGLSHDKDGIFVEGYDYSEISLFSSFIDRLKLHSIDEITDDNIRITVVCSANIVVDCEFEDYDNAVWDSEEKEYLFLDTRIMREEHYVNFPIRIVIYKNSREFDISNFNVILGGDSRKNRYELIENNGTSNFDDEERKELGFVSLCSYDDYLESNLHSSDFNDVIIKLFKKIHSVFSDLDDCLDIYSEIIDTINISMPIDDESSALISNINSLDCLECKIEKYDIQCFLEWINKERNKIDIDIEKIYEDLPDHIEYNCIYKFFDSQKNQYQLILPELQISPSEGNTEWLSLELRNINTDKVINGTIELTIGYLNFDENGCAGDGCTDSVSYNCEDILDTIKEIVDSLDKFSEMHKEICSLISDYLFER